MTWTLAQARGEVLKRVDTDDWDTAQTGVVYYSPRQDGGRYGTVYRQYFAGTGVSGEITLISSGVTQLVRSGGWSLNSNSGNMLSIGTNPSSYYVTPRLEGDALMLLRCSSHNDTGDSYKVWVDYTTEAR